MSEHEQAKDRVGARSQSRDRPSPSRGAPRGAQAVLQLQRQAGNAAVSGAVAGGAGAAPVELLVAQAVGVQRQRHGRGGHGGHGGHGGGGHGHGTSTGGAAAPPTLHHGALDAAAAQHVLSAAFSGVHAITAGHLRVERDNAAMWAAYDRVSIANHTTNSRTGVLWAAGDARRAYPGGLDGFQDPGGTDVYINSSTAGPVTSCHETLHFNAAADWRRLAGERVSEGVTEVLAQYAVRRARLRVTDTPAYVGEQRVARALVALVGQPAVEQAYFNGGASFATMSALVDTFQGTGTWAAVRAAAEARHWAQAVGLLDGSGGAHHGGAAHSSHRRGHAGGGHH